MNLVDICARLLEMGLQEWYVNYIILVENHEDDLTRKSNFEKWIACKVMMRYSCNNIRTILFNAHRHHHYPIPTLDRHGSTCKRLARTNIKLKKENIVLVWRINIKSAPPLNYINLLSSGNSFDMIIKSF